jgi:hypothetical protein
LIDALGWSNPIPFDVAAIQLKEISSKFTRDKLSQNSNTSLTEFGDKDSLDNIPQNIAEYLPAVLPHLYQRIYAAYESSSKDFLNVYNILGSEPWIWVGDSFASPSRIAFNCTINAVPYLYQVPQDMIRYMKLLQKFGVQSSFGTNDYIKVIY